MRKSFIALMVLALTCITFSSCKEKMKEMKGKVSNVEFSTYGDSIWSIKVTNEDNDTLIFNPKEAKFTNGLMIKGDSVTVGYVEGESDTLRALVIAVKPLPPSKPVTLDELKNNKLITK